MSNPAAQLTFLDLPGCTLTRRTLDIPATITDAQLPQVGSKLLSVRGCLKWAIGSVLAEMVTRKPKTKAGEPDESWANEFADAHDIDPKERREILAIHTFFPAELRTVDLSYEHYKEAMLGVHDNQPKQLQRALAYLQAAHAHAWTHTQLRRHIRSSQAQEKPDTTQTAFAGYGSVFDFRRYMQQEAAQPITPDRARLLLADIGEDTLEFIDRLRITAAKGS